MKSALRRRMRARIKAHAGDSAAVVAALTASLQKLPAARCIAIYAALPDEPELGALIQLMPGHHWHYPRVSGDQLTFHPILDPSSQLVSGSFGIREPAAGIEATAIRDLDVFICPGIAFDQRGGRLGRGRGFYDRMLASARGDALKIGVGFACQMVEDTHAERHDIPMDEVLCTG